MKKLIFVIERSCSDYYFDCMVSLLFFQCDRLLGQFHYVCQGHYEESMGVVREESDK